MCANAILFGFFFHPLEWEFLDIHFFLLLCLVNEYAHFVTSLNNIAHYHFLLNVNFFFVSLCACFEQ